MTDSTHPTQDAPADQTLTQNGNYEILKKRLHDQGKNLQQLTRTFNETRQNAFGKSQNALIGKVGVHTENRCTPVDMAQVGELILFGYHVFMGLKETPSIQDVLCLYQLERFTDSAGNDSFKIEPVAYDATFLDHPKFIQSFTELHAYYKDSRLVQIKRRDQWLYIAFQIGSLYTDRKVFRFEMIANGTVQYVDDQGHNDLIESNQSDIEWIDTTRQDHVIGKYSHVNILNRLFVECIGGNLTVKIENNTENGLGIYREDVEDRHQGIADALISYAQIAEFILLKVRPNREKNDRYLLFNPLTETVTRIDSIGKSCKTLPEDHGIIFANGYALTSGEVKIFEENWQEMRYSQRLNSPNGEDALYVFFDQSTGGYCLYSYSLIEKIVATPIHNNGYSLNSDGRMLMFRSSENAESAKIHTLRIWQTPYLSADAYSAIAQDNVPSFFKNIGNAELVRGISELNSIVNYTQHSQPTRALFETLITYCQRTLDQYYWLNDDQTAGISDIIRLIVSATTDIIGEFAKVQALSVTAIERLEAYAQLQQELIRKITLAPSDNAAILIGLLSELKSANGHLITLKTEKYINLDKIQALHLILSEEIQALNQRLIVLLQDERAYQPYLDRIAATEKSIEKTDKSADLLRAEQEVNGISDDLILVNEEVAAIETDDPTQTTRILDFTAHVLSRLNALLAHLKNRQNSIRTVEADAEFASRFKLLSQALTAALSQIQTPEDCDTQQARLLGMVEQLETRFAAFDQFLAEIYLKRDEITTTFENYKQTQLSAQQKRIENIASAAAVSLTSIEHRIQKFETMDALNRYFASDAMVQKVKQLSGQIRDLGDSVRSEDLDAKLKIMQDQSLRALRDNQDIFEEGGSIIKLGQHRFTVNKQVLDLTITKHHQKPMFHLTGTAFYQEITDQAYLELEAYADLEIASESADIYRAEYLAYTIIDAAQSGQDNLTLAQLYHAMNTPELATMVQKFAAPKYREGYIKGVHDDDAVKILNQILPLYKEAGLLRISQLARMQGLILLRALDEQTTNIWIQKSKEAMLLRHEFGLDRLFLDMKAEIVTLLRSTPILDRGLAETNTSVICEQAAEYLVCLLGSAPQFGNAFEFTILVSREAKELAEAYLSYRQQLVGYTITSEATLLSEQFEHHHIWLTGYCQHQNADASGINLQFIDEAAGIAVLMEYNLNHPKTQWHIKSVDFSLSYVVKALLGQHVSLQDQCLHGTLDQFLLKGLKHQTITYPNYVAFLEKRRTLIESARTRFSLEDFKARPLTSFVRNKLISESYLKLIGANFAKQMGAFGDNKRTDLMGMLLLISPPGYGKTTLIEYIAHKMGLVFMKINCPALGHDVVSLDPKDAPNVTAAREIEKLNLGLEMGTNVLLYLDDIQHTNPEFLQKFIALCDGTRRIEGVFEGQPKTYDMRGKKFAIVMAGNPYTESGEAFKIPDMLANRADIYNLGDMLSDQEDAFELSYIENALTSNSVLAPLATRNLNDVYKMVAMSKGEPINQNELEYAYSALEVREIVTILQKLLKVQAVLLKINQQYIASAAMADHYRTEPAFKLQGSYRNMNKLAEKVVSALSDSELEMLITDHYQGEAQTLTIGAEENLLKLAELRGILNDAQKVRWQEIKSRFARHLETGGEEDPQVKIVNQLSGLNQNMQSIGKLMEDASEQTTKWQSYQYKLAQSKLAQDKIKQEESIDNDRINMGQIQAIEIGQSIQNYLGSLSVSLKALSEGVSRNSALNNSPNQNQNIQGSQQLEEKLEAVIDGMNKIAKAIAEQPRPLATQTRFYPKEGFVVRSDGRKLAGDSEE